MMDDIVEKVQLKIKKITKLQRDQAKQDGQEEQLLTQLHDVSGKDSVEEANKKLTELGKELVEYEELLEDIDSQMGEIISKATSSENTDTHGATKEDT